MNPSHKTPDPRSHTPPPAISATTPDWSRERLQGCSSGPHLLATLRAYQNWQSRRGPFAALACKFYVFRHRHWSIIAGADIPLNSNISGGLLIPHPNGIVIHPDAKIGPNCLIHQQVTIGVDGKSTVAPVIGGHVDIGAGAKILGPITIGNHAKIGANAVVLCNVPDHATAVGIPARIILADPPHPSPLTPGPS